MKLLRRWLIVFFLALFVFYPIPAQAQVNRCPSAQIRDVLKPIWDFRRPRLSDSITEGLTKGDTEVLYNVQVLTNNLLEMAANCTDTTTLQQLVDMYLLAYPHLKTSGNGYKEWRSSSGGEVILHSSQFIYLLSRTANILASLPTNSLSSSMREFLQKYVPVIANDHLHKWISVTSVFSHAGWGCADRGSYTHHEYLGRLLSRALGNSPTYCNVVRDRDLWIIAAAAELLAADKRSDLITLNSSQTNELRSHVALGSQLIQSRLNETSLTNFAGQSVRGLNFDQGMWRDYSDYQYACYTGSSFPQPSNRCISPTVGWDFSHARRFINVFMTLLDTRFATEQTFPDETVLKKLANQVAYKMFNKDFNRPLFTNFWDGTNGWYRVNYSNRVGFGYAPNDLSVSFPTGGYGFWGRFNPDIDKIMEAVWKIIDSSDPEIITFRNNHYGSFYSNYQRKVPDWNKNTSANLLMMLPTVIGVSFPTPTLIPTPTSTFPANANFSFKIKFQGISGYAPSKNVRVILKQGGVEKYRFESVSVAADNNGVYSGTVSNISPGTYDILIKGWAHLQKKLSNITLSPETNIKDFSSTPLKAGDFDNDNVLNINDISSLLSKYTSLSVPVNSQNQNFDIDANNVININDVSLVLANYNTLEVRGDE